MGIILKSNNKTNKEIFIKGAIMELKCCRCGRDIDEIYQDNISYELGYPLCEDCAGLISDSVSEEKKYLSKKQFKFLMKHAGVVYSIKDLERLIKV